MPKALTLSLSLFFTLVGIPVSAANAQQPGSLGLPPSAASGNIAQPQPYQGPNGHYDNPADFERSLNGTPCGVECTKRERARWGLDGQ